MDYSNSVIFTKVKAAAVVVLVAVIVAFIDAVTNVEFADFGPWGLVIGSAVATAAAYAKKEIAAFTARRHSGPGLP